MSEANDVFFVTMGAVMAGNMFSALFIWGLVTYTRLERAGASNSGEGRLPIAAMVLGGVMGVLSILIAVQA